MGPGEGDGGMFMGKIMPQIAPFNNLKAEVKT